MGTSTQFITDTAHNQIAEKLKRAFSENFRYEPPPSEVNSWRNSLRAVSLVFQQAHLTDHGVILEYKLPLTSRRLDCLVTGRDSNRRDNAVIIELKQWEDCEPAEGDNEVLTWVGGAEREILHPSVQVGQYKMYLQDGHTAFYEGETPILLNACSYLHNYSLSSDDILLWEKFEQAIEKCPLFSADDVDTLCEYLTGKLAAGEGIDVLRKIEDGNYRTSKKLMEHVGNVIKGKPEYILLDEQLVVYDTEEFDFRIFHSPQALEDAIRERASRGFTARMTAGYCWDWSKKPNKDGTLKDDVQIGSYRRPWNARPEATRLARGIPKAPLWAYDPGGMDQVGCVYTAQGFEFDYIGVIFGNDLVYDLDGQEWIGRKGNSRYPVVRRSVGPVSRPGQEHLPGSSLPGDEGLLRLLSGQEYGAILQEPHGSGGSCRGAGNRLLILSASVKKACS